MRKYYYLAYDIACICIALVAALYLRHGIPLIQEGPPSDLYLLLLVTFISAACVLTLMHTHTSMWRFTSTSNLADILVAVALVILITNSSLFIISRLEMMPRSVPPMHWALAVVAMGGSRLVARQLFGPARKLTKTQSAHKQHVIVVGACHTAELYLQFIKRIIQHEIVVVGFVDSNPALTDRIFQKHKILGTPEQLAAILDEFLVHGVEVQQIILAHTLDELSATDQKLLLDMMENGTIDLVHFGKHMAPQMQPQPAKNANDFYQKIDAVAPSIYETPRGVYPYLKRIFDIVVALVLFVVLMPLLAVISLIVALDVGIPILFWQLRPGLRGKPFRLYKFRSMRHAGRTRGQDRLSHKSGDPMRTSSIGKMLRHVRLDELPQLFHIITGAMSFVGPRPLLPDDQPAGGQVRLSVRPGVTGWAQIHGGDALTPEEKLALDIWYIRHMSLWLDMRILLRTLLVVLKIDKPRIGLADHAS